jgi:hypothetical protein
MSDDQPKTDGAEREYGRQPHCQIHGDPLVCLACEAEEDQRPEWQRPHRVTPPRLRGEPERESRCSGCGHRWSAPVGFIAATGAELCGDCWRRGQAAVLGSVPPDGSADVHCAHCGRWMGHFAFSGEARCWECASKPPDGSGAREKEEIQDHGAGLIGQPIPTSEGTEPRLRLALERIASMDLRYARAVDMKQIAQEAIRPTAEHSENCHFGRDAECDCKEAK